MIKPQNPSFGAICFERDRLLAEDAFQRAPVMSDLLRYLVDQYLENPDEQIKSYTIAVDALGRKASFDAMADSYPRVQVARLRKLLDRCYASYDGDVRLTIPKGQYQINVEEKNPRPNGSAAAPSGEIIGKPAPIAPDAEILQTEPEIGEIISACQETEVELPPAVQTALIQSTLNKDKIRKLGYGQAALIVICIALATVILVLKMNRTAYHAKQEAVAKASRTVPQKAIPKTAVPIKTATAPDERS